MTKITSLSAGTWLAIGYLALISTVVAYFSYLYALRIVGAAQAGVYLYLDPVAAAMIAAALLGETITPLIILGGVLVLSGVYVTTQTGPSPE